jgi:hypothetical protein
MTPAEQRDRLIAAIEDHRNTQGDEAGCMTASEAELWLVLGQVKAERYRTLMARWDAGTLTQREHLRALVLRLRNTDWQIDHDAADAIDALLSELDQ